MKTYHLLQHEMGIKEINIVTSKKLAEKTYPSRSLSYTIIDNCKKQNNFGCIGLMALVNSWEFFQGQQILTKDSYTIEKNINHYLLKKNTINGINIYQLRHRLLRSSDTISDFTFNLKAIEGHDLNYLFREIRIFIGEQLLFQLKDFNESKIRLDCLIPLISIQMQEVSLDIILSSNIIDYPNAIFNCTFTQNYLDTVPRRFLAQNEYIFSDQIGFVEGGEFHRKLTLESIDDEKLSKIFKYIPKEDYDHDQTFLGNKKDLYDYDEYIILLSKSKTLQKYENMFPEHPKTNLAKTDTNYIKFQLFDSDGDTHNFGSCLTQFKYNSMNLLRNNTEIIIKATLGSNFDLNYNLKLQSTSFYLKLTYFFPV